MDYFGKLPAALADDGRVPKSAKALYASLALMAMPTDGIVYQPNEVLAARLGISKRAFQWQLQSLVSAGYAAREGRNGDASRPLRLLQGDEATRAVSARQAKADWKVGRAFRNLHGTGAKSCTGPVQNLARDISVGIERTQEETPPTPKGSESQPENEMDDWKRIAAETVDPKGAAEARAKKAAKAAARGPRRTSTGTVALPSEVANTPRERWTTRHLYGHFLQRLQEEDPSLARLRTDAVLPPRQQRHLKDLLDYVQRPEWHPDDALSNAVQLIARFIDHVFDHSDRLKAALKIRGAFSPGVLWGFREPLLADFHGSANLGRSLAAASDAAATHDESFTSTSEGL